MNKGYITITESKNHEFTVEAKLVNGNVWLSQWEMATLFNVFTKKIESNLKSIFKAGLLRENEVSMLHTYQNGDYTSEAILYNLEAIIFISFRIGSFEANAFRQWVLKAFSEYMKNEKARKTDFLVILKSGTDIPLITSLN